MELDIVQLNQSTGAGGNVRLVKSCEWLPQPIQDYKPIPLPLLLPFLLQSDESVDIWATSLALSWLSQHYTEQYEEWELIQSKANVWLKQQAIHGERLTMLENAAKNLLKPT